MRLVSIISGSLFIILVYVASCASKQSVDYNKQLDTIQIMLTHADQNLAIEPDYMQLRVDTMRAKIFYIDSLMPGLAYSEGEVGAAYNVYSGAMIVFQEYVDRFDPLYFENQNLQKELAEMRKGLQEKQGEELNELVAEIPLFRSRCSQNYMATKVLIRKYLDIVRPYYRKKKVIDHLFTKLVENNSEPK